MWEVMSIILYYKASGPVFGDKKPTPSFPKYVLYNFLEKSNLINFDHVYSKKIDITIYNMKVYFVMIPLK
jgi:hypothetical protein